MRTPISCLLMLGAMPWAAACSSPDVRLGDGDDPAGTTMGAGGSDGGPREAFDAAPACNGAVELPSTEDVWWEWEWTSSAPLLPIAQCGLGTGFPTAATAPSVIAKWVAPSDGQYMLLAWSRDITAVVTADEHCGQPYACAALAGMGPDLPAPPFDVTFPGSGFNFYPEPGQTLYVWFYADTTVPGDPETGHGVLNIRKVP
jgi:hypothetical protein